MAIINGGIEREMERTTYLLLLCLLPFVVYGETLSKEAMEGKALYPSCDVCHNQAMDPPLGPPMWGVKRRYLQATLDEEDFVQSMVNFVKAPTLETAIHDEALAQMGLMPPLPLPDEMLRKISLYILQTDFPAPCNHWEVAVRRAMERGDPEHAARDRNMLNRYCR